MLNRMVCERSGNEMLVLLADLVCIYTNNNYYYYIVEEY